MPTPRLEAQHTALLVVDVQEKLLPSVCDPDGLVQRIAQLIDGINVLELPVLVTEQYPKGLGPTVGQLANRLKTAVCKEEKLKFSACIEPVREALVKRGVRTVLVCGVEAHVCVLQTCLDLMDRGFVPAVVVDAISSGQLADQEAAVQRLIQAGAIPTTVESALLELVHEAGGDRFRSILPLIR